MVAATRAEVEHAETAMAEWLILLLFVPAVVVPVVLLVGFAGCDLLWGIDRVKYKPALNKAEGKNAGVITLTWTWGGPPAARFKFERLKVGNLTPVPFEATTSPFDDNDENKGLVPATNYLYRVQAVFSDGDTSPWSADTPNVLGTTRALQNTFQAPTPVPGTEPPWEDSSGWEGYSLVLRIEAARLSTSGAWVRLTIRGSPIDNNYARIKTISISRADPVVGMDPYDSADDPVLIASDILLAPKQKLHIPDVNRPAINYSLDHDQHLLIAVDFDGVTASSIGSLPVPPDWLGTVVAYWNQLPNAAMLKDRPTGYTPDDYIFLIEEIEVG